MFFDLSSAQSKVYTDTQQTLLAVRDTQARLASTKGGMHWKTISGAEYLYRTLDGKGTAKSLGRRSPETEQIYQSFHDKKNMLSERLRQQTARLDEMKRMARALRLGHAPKPLMLICSALENAGLLGKNVMIIGTNALYAYEAMAGIQLFGDLVATGDMDMLWKHKAALTAAARDIGPQGFIGILRKADKTFEVSKTQPFRAINNDGYMVDLIRQMPKPPWADEPHNLGQEDDFVATEFESVQWLLSSPSIEQCVIASDGTPFMMTAPDPRAFTLYKAWMSQQPDREPVKRIRDLAQARSLWHLLQERLPQFPLDNESLQSFPEAIRSSELVALMESREEKADGWHTPRPPGW